MRRGLVIVLAQLAMLLGAVQMCRAGMEFDGTNDVVVVLDSAKIQNVFDGGGTFEAWIRPESIGQTAGRIADKANGGVTGWILYLVNPSGNTCDLSLSYEFDGARGVWSSQSRVITFNEMNHIVMTFNASSDANNPAFYVNGQSVTVDEDISPSGTRTSDAGYDLYIGDRKGGARAFDGSIDRSRIIPRAITAAEVSELYASGGNFRPNDGTNTIPPVLDVFGAIGYSDGATLPNGTAVQDISGSGLNGVASNGVTQTTGQVSTNALGYTLPYPTIKPRKRR